MGQSWVAPTTTCNVLIASSLDSTTCPLLPLLRQPVCATLAGMPTTYQEVMKVHINLHTMRIQRFCVLGVFWGMKEIQVGQAGAKDDKTSAPWVETKVVQGSAPLREGVWG